MTWAHPENRVWSHTFTPRGGEEGGHGTQTTSLVTWAAVAAGRGTLQARSATLLLLFTNTQQSFKCSSFIKRRREEKGKLKTKIQRIKRTTNKQKTPKHRKTKQTRKTNATVSLGDNRVDRSHTRFVVCTSITEVATRRGVGHIRVSACSRHSATHTHVGERTRAHTPHAGPRAPTHTHSHAPRLIHTQTRAHGQWAKGGGLSPVRVFLYVIIRGGTIKEARVEGLPLLPSGEDSRDGAESHLLFLLFPFLVFKIL